MKLSVVATVRNEREGIREFVESLLAQRLRPDEIIIVDGASSDGTLQILQEYERARRIGVISRECNIAQGRNIGIAAAQNELVAVTDAGCRVDPDWLLHMAACFARSDSPDVVAGNFDFETRNAFEEASVYATISPNRETSELAKYYPSSRSVAFRKSAWQAAKGYPEWLYAAEDTLFDIRLWQLGFKFQFCKEAKVRWRPRQSWGGLWKQHFNYARGNGRIALSSSGYITNLQYHMGALLLLLGGFAWPLLPVATLLVLAQHVRANLWQQARAAERACGRKSMFWRVLVLMEVVRLAGMAGFIAGRFDRVRRPDFVRRQIEWMGTDSVEETTLWPNWTSVVMLLAIPSQTVIAVWWWGWKVVAPALLLTSVLTLRSVKDSSRTGQQLEDEILKHYRRDSLFALARLALWSLVLCLLMAGAGMLVFEGVAALFPSIAAAPLSWLAGLGGIAAISALQFCRHLLYIPASLAASSNTRLTHFYPLWRVLSPARLAIAKGLLVGLFVTATAASARRFAALAAREELILTLLSATLSAAITLAAGWCSQARPAKAPTPGRKGRERPNILMIGVDTLRADRLGVEGYSRKLTPAIDALAREGAYLAQCFVPCARTAPSLASLLSGCWPRKHGIRDDFSRTNETSTDLPYLPRLLGDAGYRTIAISDWAGTDLGKFPFGFDLCDLPQDQWNIQSLLGRKPKSVRMFLSLFTHNRFGKKFLPELYWLPGVPMTGELGRETRAWINRCARSEQPFLINVFFSTAHAPFGAEYPYYTLFADRGYDGESKFVVANLTEPFDIVERQPVTPKPVDLEQIVRLYDGCVRRLDDEVARLVEHLRVCGLEDNTLLVLYADHGIEFFERGTWGQGNSVIVDDSARIPVILLDPRRPHGVRLGEVTRSVDIAPTLLHLVGLPIPEDMDGVSLVPVLERRQRQIALPAYVETGIWFSKAHCGLDGHLHYPDLPELLEVPQKSTGTLAIRPEFKHRVIEAKDRMLRTDRWKLTYFPLRDGGALFQLFDVESDPECRVNVSNRFPEVFAKLQHELLGWLGGEAPSDFIEAEDAG